MKNLSVRQWIGLGFSIVGTICGVIFIVKFATGGDNYAVMFLIALLCALISYILCGGLGYTIKAALGVAKAMWFLIPFFPVNILLGTAGFFLGLFFLFFVPIFFVIKSIRAKQA